jgi:6-pyruvoyltetrahydropterin/6-carboxytetrahydropterin synthase
MIRRSVTKTFKFSAGHFLPNHNGKCKGQHGHNYRVEVSIKGPVHPIDGSTEEGMILDFGVLKTLWQPLYDYLDHKNLNDLFANVPTTAEQLANYIFTQMEETLPHDTKVNYVRVWETDDSSATIENV